MIPLSCPGDLMKSSLRFVIGAALAALLGATGAHAQSDELDKLDDAAAVVRHFASDEGQSIPVDLLERAHGIAVIPNVIRGGLIFGARRGRGVLVVRTADGSWSNPGFVTLTGGSIGWQIGAESMDVVLVFANDRSVRNIRSGKFTLGGDATAVAGPLGRHATMAVTFRAEVYGYIASRGLFAGAAFEGMRLAIDDEANARMYAPAPGSTALEPRSAELPPAAQDFLLSLAAAETEDARATRAGDADRSGGEAQPALGEEARTFPLEGAP